MIRLICDCRRANACHRKPPKTRLGGPDSLTDLDLSEFTLSQQGFGGFPQLDFHQAATDVKDAFFQSQIKEMACWFGLDVTIIAADWGITSVYDDETKRNVPVSPHERLQLCVEAMSMGWTWALYFCNEGTSACIRDSSVLQEVRDKEPPRFASAWATFGHFLR